MPADARVSRTPGYLLAGGMAVLAWSGFAPKDRFTWLLEVFPAILAAGVLIATRRRFPLTSLLYALIFVHAVILMVGGKYTYAEVPLFNWIRDAFGLARNHYDRVGHFAQGFVPAVAAREVLIRLRVVRRGGWLFTLVVSVCLAVSALYELLEWSVAAATGTAADAFLGTQGDVWDTQKDMLFALIGAVCALVSLSGIHDRQIAALEREPS